ncbi:hypothetical protein CMI47_10145 [Candidatus Pacearchaeota archaeon]|jgi:hypothetical protein|nr:hypothetical protein [Candidatus Pacearchaeota archaeon]|tara:strand:- start:5417 stop:5656 length:240 start_codon:yes stop_codon:yes gene_type:complete
MKHYLCTDIKWDTDGDNYALSQLPKTVLIVDCPDDEDPEEYLRDRLSDKSGFCHFGFDFVQVMTDFTGSIEKVYYDALV